MRLSFQNRARRAVVGWLAVALGVTATLTAALPSVAQERPRPHRGARVHAAQRVLTIRRHTPRVAALRPFGERDYSYENGVYVPGPLRRWNDPTLESFGGWRLGGDTFYGDGRGDTITRGNATLGAISGYGGARGGYGGPHFDSVGGFHDGPGPDAQEDADYASGSISTPDYGGIVPRYPTLRARVAALNTGVVPRISAARLVASPPALATAPARAIDDEDPGFVRRDDMFPDLD